MKEVTLESLLKNKKNPIKEKKYEWKGIATTMSQEEREILEQHAKENYKAFGGLVREIVLKYIERKNKEME